MAYAGDTLDSVKRAQGFKAVRPAYNPAASAMASITANVGSSFSATAKSAPAPKAS